MVLVYGALAVELALEHVRGAFGDASGAMIRYHDNQKIAFGAESLGESPHVLGKRRQVPVYRLCMRDASRVFALVKGDINRQVIQEVDIVFSARDRTEIADARQV